MLLSVALLSIGIIFLAIPKLNAKVDLWLSGVPYVSRIRAPAATILCAAGLLGILMEWF